MDEPNLNIAIVIPTFNAGQLWPDCINGIKIQACPIKIVLIIDSESSDNTQEVARKNGFTIHKIKSSQFNHGATRQLAVNLLSGINIDIVVFLTQDAVLTNSNALTELIKGFTDSSVGAAYGKQLPRKVAKPIEAHGRFFNYPDYSYIKSINEKAQYGFNLIFISNSFAAYKMTALKEAGGFPINIILGEDTLTCAKLLITGWKIAYQSNAQVFHSHNYSIKEEAFRYFDTGVMHARKQWLLNEFGETGGRGLKFVRSELLYLLQISPLLIPEALLRTLFKYVFYKLGRFEKILPLRLKKRLSMNKNFWSNSNTL